jgi:hypothetical protein
LTPGQIPALALALVSTVVDALVAFGGFGLDANEKTAILAVASTAIALGVALYAMFSHQQSMGGKR